MDIQNWGEESFIQYLAENFTTKNVLMGIGDDCAVIPNNQGSAWLITTDALVEDIHFLKNQIPAKDLGYKTVAVNVSDIAAMGGTPLYAFLSVALPKSTNREWLYELAKGIKEACEKWNISLLGGDTVGSRRDTFLNLTLIGTAPLKDVKYRHFAEVGDIICVNRFLGDSAGGLKALQSNLKKTTDVKYLINAHFHPEVFFTQAIWLSEHSAVHAMMDVSDGINCDLKRLIKSSKKGAILETSQIPLSMPLLKVSKKEQWDPLELALSGGEDYCLLLTIAKEAFEEIQNAFKQEFGTPLYPIGTIDHSNELRYLSQGKSISLALQDFDHFQQ